MRDDELHGVYGLPPDGLVDPMPGARQFSPLIPGSAALETQPAGSLAGLVMLAPAGTVERRFAIALALKALAPGGSFTILAPKDRGGSRLGDELAGFGCRFEETARRHHRLCHGTRPGAPAGLEDALAEGGPQTIEALAIEGLAYRNSADRNLADRNLADRNSADRNSADKSVTAKSSGLWSQPGIFSWDRIDPGSALLVRHLPALAGRGADFGCGIGILAMAALASPKLVRLSLLDIDARAIEAARRNLADARVDLRWADVRQPDPSLVKLDFVLMNPPFHDGGGEDRTLGQAFIRRAAESLRTGGRLWLTANRHLPYEAVLKPLFRHVTPIVASAGYKVFEAQK